MYALIKQLKSYFYVHHFIISKSTIMLSKFKYLDYCMHFLYLRLKFLLIFLKK